jgi:hypothetical protein
MTCRQTIVVLVIFFSLASIMGCGGGSSMNSPGSSNGSGPATIDIGGGSGDTTPGRTVALAWEAPATNTDGTPLTDLAGYRIYYRTDSGRYGGPLEVGSANSCSLINLAQETYYFVVTAYNSVQAESGFSNEAAKTIL